MSLSQARSYINQRMPNVNSDLIEWTDAFNDENIPQTLIDNRYHIELGETTITHDDNIVDKAMDITITMFKRAYNDTVGNRDALLDIGHCVVMDLVNPKNVETFGGDLKNVEGSSITTEEIDVSNDNVIKMEVNMNFRLVYCAV